VHRHQSEFIGRAREKGGDHAAAHGIVDGKRLVFGLTTMWQATTDGEPILLRMRARAEAVVVSGEHLGGGIRSIYFLQRHDVRA
jgi:hypothetical protein